MKKELSPSVHFLSKLICLLIIILIQFPAVSTAFDFRESAQSRARFLSNLPEINFPAQNNNSALVVFSNSTSITIADAPSGGRGLASLYPSPITVSGLSGTISDVNVTITGITAARPRDLDFLLVAPTGQTFVMMADAGGTAGCGITNVNITLDDSAAAQLPNNDATGCPPGAPIATGTYRPTNIVFGTEVDTFPSPAPAAPYNQAAPTGTATFASVFNGLNPNGTWNLYVVDDSLGGGSSTISGGWSIDITTAGGVAATTTTVSSNLNPALTTQTITFTSTTTQVSNGSPVTAGTVSFTNNGSAIAGCTNVAVNASGNATCATTLGEGTRTITATYNGTGSFGTSSGSLSQVVNSPTVVTGSQFCNNGGITVTDGGSATVYPSNITVSGLFGTISNVTVQLNGLNAPRPNNLDILLVGAGNQAFQIMSDVGDGVTPANVNLILDDNAASLLPQGTAISSGTFDPTDYDVIATPDIFPAPAPGAFSRPAPTGTATFASVYGSSNPNGTWRLYAVDDGIGGGNSTITSWCVNFTLNKFATATTIVSSLNPSTQGQSVTFTATVTSAGGTPTGSVQFFDGATSLGTVALNGSGQASLTTSALPTGSRNITAQYLGANIGAGGGGYANSTSSNLVQAVNPVVAANVSVEGRVLSATGKGIAKALVILTDRNGELRYTMTNPFGHYRFTDIQAGEVYIFSVSAKNRRFASRAVTINEGVTGLDIIEESP